MTAPLQFVAAGLALALGLAGAAGGAEPAPNAPASLETVEGTVTALSESPGESGLPVLVAVLDPGEGSGPIQILLAPRGVLEEIDFPIEVGDRLKVRVFVGGDPPLPTQRVLNLGRDSLVRLRTLRQVPLWSSTGAWQGGDTRARPGRGPGGDRQGGGGPERRPPAGGGHGR